MCAGKRSWQFLNYLSSVLYLPLSHMGGPQISPRHTIVSHLHQENLVPDSASLFHSQDQQPNHAAPSLIMWLALSTSLPVCSDCTEEPDG